MPNPYFTNPNNLMPNQRATAESVSADFDLVQTGFALLPSPTDITNGKISYSVDSGTVNAMVANGTYAPVGLVDGLLVSVKCSHAVTGAATINVNSLGVKPLLRPDGSAINNGDIQAGQVFDARYNATLLSWALVALNVYPAAGAGTAVTQSPGDNSANIATTAFTDFSFAKKSSIQNQVYVTAITAGANPNFTVTLSPAPTAYVAGLRFTVALVNGTTGAFTLNVNGLGSGSVYVYDTNGTPVTPPSYPVGYIVDIFYNGGGFIILNNTVGNAQLYSPAFTGTPSAPTFAINDVSTKIATTAFVQQALGSYTSLGVGTWLTPSYANSTILLYGSASSNRIPLASSVPLGTQIHIISSITSVIYPANASADVFWLSNGYTALTTISIGDGGSLTFTAASGGVWIVTGESALGYNTKMFGGTASLQRFPSGKVIQTGSASTDGAGAASVVFPSTFDATPIIVISGNNASSIVYNYVSPTASGFTVHSWTSSTGALLATQAFEWIAIGAIA